MYLFLEYLDHHNKSYENYFFKYGPLYGALLGVIPQCGFSIIASLLFIENKVTLGTLISVFIATSDEAIPILIAKPSMYSSLIVLLLMKFIIAIIVGYLVDFIFKNKINQYSFIKSTHSHEHHIFIEALVRTLKVYTFIFIIHFVLSFFIEKLGYDTLSQILMNQSLFQPIISALFGFIPNCASSLILTELYIHHTLSFASLIAGLITNAGLGLVILIKNHVDIKVILKICLILFFTSLIIGLPLQFFYLS